jgi:hypothetical protein
MAITKTRLKDGYNIEGKFASQIVDITLDSSYPTGGESILPSEVGLKAIYGARILGYKDATSGGYEIKWDYDSNKLMAFVTAGFTPAGTNSAPAFTGSALAAHGHVLHFQTSAAANAVTAAANSLRTPAAAFDVASVANNSGEGGIVQISAGTPAGTVAAPTFTGTAVAAAAGAEVANGVDLSLVSVRVQFVGLGA